ncbi:putative B3 domain-containing protein REM4 [Salvia splendens]|uniref:putative B3 domain-containing protein REM4 n=1 Tax=Salvia splendens TaxID=180675 RepID=UPI001C26200F|nr:putative B3 domain-containing protein REM4 [Salvia splendens]
MANNGAMEYLRLPSIMKKFSETTSLNELRIPPEFVALHGANLPFDCRLITLLGRRSFSVRVLNIASGCHLQAGWSDFRVTNEIVHDDVLTFTMVDAGVFLVKRFNPRTGCPPLGDLQATGYGDSDHSDAPDVDTSDDYVPTQSEGSFSSDGDDYASDAGVLDDDGCPTFTVTLDASNINRTLEIPMAFWHRHIRMISLQDPVYFNVNGDSWYIILDHNETKIWVKHGWRRFKERNNLVVGVCCHFKLIDRNEVQFYVWFDLP